MPETLFDVLQYPLYLALIILVLFLVMFIHEMGHFLAAKIFKIPVKSVVIGRGKLLKQWTSKNETRWALHALPFGAHVHLYGMEEMRDGQYIWPYWKRIITILAGPAINILTPFLILPFFYIAIGQPSGPSIISAIEIGLLADKAGLEPGDKFLAMNDKKFTNVQDIWRIAYSKGTEENRYTIQRGDKIFDIDLKPGWEKYDSDGITRENARFGVMWLHTPFYLKSLLSINGARPEKDESLAREKIIESFDRESLISIKAVNNEETFFRVRIPSKHNQALLDPESDDYDKVFLGSQKGNFYLRQNLLDSLTDSLRDSSTLVTNIISLPFQLLPVDSSRIQPPYAVSKEKAPISSRVYIAMHLFFAASIFLALFNLLPLPKLDGGYIAIHTIEKLKKKPLEPRGKAKVYIVAFLIVYMSVLFSNIDNLPRYIDSRLKKLHEFMYQNE